MYYETSLSILIILLLLIIKSMYDNVISYIKDDLERISEGEINSSIPSYMIHKKYVDNVLLSCNSDFYDEPIIRELAHYAVKNGKRIRSVIISSIYEKYYNIDINKVNNKNLRNYICSIEYTHASSLILDDIMDGDSLRRSDPCMYIKYGIPKTQIIAMMLMAQAFKKIYDTGIDIGEEHLKNSDHELYGKYYMNVCKEIFDNYEKCSIGQYLDLYSNTDDVSLVLHNKTVTLFEISYLLAWTLTYASKDYNLEIYIEKIRSVSKYMGMLFQIADDFTDIEVDRKNGSKFNYIINYGLKRAFREYMRNRELWISISKELQFDTDSLTEIVDYLTKRTLRIYKSRVKGIT